MRVTLNPLKAIANIRRSLRIIRQLRQTKQVLQQLLKTENLTEKDIRTMSSDEFYTYLTDPADLSTGSEKFYQFLLDYVITGYLHGELKDLDIQALLGLNNPLQLNRYVDRMLRDARMRGSFMEELVAHALQSKEDPSPLYTMLFSPTEYDPQTGAFMVKSFADVKKVLQENQQVLQEQKKQLAIARMRATEKQRQDALRQKIALQNPESLELAGTDDFVSEDSLVEKDARVVYAELQKQVKGTVIRSAAAEQHKVQNTDMHELSPSEQIAYKKKLLAKVRAQEQRPGMNVRI
jgi:hypothetical protein